jgi:hypothetical protein
MFLEIFLRLLVKTHNVSDTGSGIEISNGQNRLGSILSPDDGSRASFRNVCAF